MCHDAELILKLCEWQGHLWAAVGNGPDGGFVVAAGRIAEELQERANVLRAAGGAVLDVVEGSLDTRRDAHNELHIKCGFIGDHGFGSIDDLEVS